MIFFLFALFHLSFQLSQNVDVTKCCGGRLILNLDSVLFLCTRFLVCCLSFLTLYIFECAAVRQDNALAVLVELDYLERKFLTQSGLCAIFLDKMLRSGKALYAFFQRNDGTLLQKFGYLALMYAAYGICTLEYVPGILLKLFVTEAQTTVLLVDVENDNLNRSANLCEL